MAACTDVYLMTSSANDAAQLASFVFLSQNDEASKYQLNLSKSFRQTRIE